MRVPKLKKKEQISIVPHHIIIVIVMIIFIHTYISNMRYMIGNLFKNNNITFKLDIQCVYALYL